MKRRCFNPNDEHYADYGGRGIAVCQQWVDSFDVFLVDVGLCPPRMTLDRINNDGNYEPGNVRWASHRAQCNNRRTTRRVEIEGRTLSLAQWAEELGMKRRTLYSRLRNGWDMSDAISRTRYSRKESN